MGFIQRQLRDKHGVESDSLSPSSSLPLQEIHKRVMALSFRNCHTKIRHVDAHATLNEGVVVQVMGELSNNMQPMRKFMQTFVLAPEVGPLNPILNPLPPPPKPPAGS